MSSAPPAVTRFLQYFLVSDYKHSSFSLNSNQSYCYTQSRTAESPRWYNTIQRLHAEACPTTVYFWSNCVPCPGSF